MSRSELESRWLSELCKLISHDYVKLTYSFVESMHYAIEIELAGQCKPGKQMIRAGYIISHATRRRLEEDGTGAEVEGTTEDGSNVTSDVFQRRFNPE